MGQILRLLAFNEDFFYRYPSIQIGYTQGQRTLLSNGLSFLLENTGLSLLGSKYGPYIWSSQEDSFQNLLFTLTHKTIIELTGIYQFQKLPESTWLTSNLVNGVCDKLGENKMENGKVVQNCVTATSQINQLTGETFGPDSICVSGTIWFAAEGFTKPSLDARCVKFNKDSVSSQFLITLSRSSGTNPIVCTNQNAVIDTVGTVYCPNSSVYIDGSSVESCNSDCFGKGVCIFGQCKCVVDAGITDAWCFVSCSDGYYQDSGICKNCIPTCQTCTDGKSCVTCKDANSLPANICSCAQPSNDGSNPCSNPTCNSLLLSETGSQQGDQAICFSCRPNCQTCIYQFVNSKIQNQCTECNDGYFLDAAIQQCLQCDANCQKCSGSSSFCQSCLVGVLTNNSCLCGENQEWQTNQCMCQVGYQIFEGVCVQCGFGCISCLISQNNSDFNHLVCTACFENFYLDQAWQKCKRCPIGCSKCKQGGLYGDVICSKCFDSFDQNQNGRDCSCSKTIAWISNLYQCVTSDQFELCPQGGIMMSSLCVDCGVQCRQCYNNYGTISCTLCEDGFFINQTTCSRCQWGCLKCSSKDTCETCWDSSATKSGGSCVCNQPSTVMNANHQCMPKSNNVCGNYYYLDDNGKQCDVCKPHCLVCVKGKCYQCIDGFYVNSDDSSCKQCLPSCSTCSSGDGCLTCKNIQATEPAKCSCQANQFINQVTNLCENLPSSQSIPTCQQFSSLITIQSKNIQFCLRCADNCIECTQSDVNNYSNSVCTNCSLGYAKSSSVENNCINCYLYCQQYDECKQLGFYWSPQQEMCLECDNCQPGFCSIQVTYQAADPQLFYQSCTACYDGFYILNGHCLPCSERCTLCIDSADNCTSCASVRLVAPSCACPVLQFETVVNGALTCVSYSITDTPTCPNGLKFSENDNKQAYCVPCADNCANCQIENLTQPVCSKCNTSFGWDDSRQSCNKCPPTCSSCEFFLDQTYCTECVNSNAQPPYCSCPANQYFEQGSTNCVDQCKSGSAVLSDPKLSNVCVACSLNCARCSALYLQKTKHQITIVTNCQNCSDGYFNLNNVCLPCDSRCATCHLDGNECDSCSKNNGNSVPPQCFCVDGTFFDIQTGLCISTCATQKSNVASAFEYVCLPLLANCANASYQINHITKLAIKGSQFCTQCLSGYFMKYDPPQCLKCQSSCATCLNYQECLTCRPELTFINGQCACPRLQHLDSETSICVPAEQSVGCPPGFQFALFQNLSTQCLLCPFGCSECQFQRDQIICFLCLDSFYYDNASLSCIKCPSTCSKCFTKDLCYQCKYGAPQQNGVCTCLPGYHLDYISQNCLAKSTYKGDLCPFKNTVISPFPGGPDNSTLCLECQQGCISCQLGANSQPSCSQCDEGYIIDPVQKVCVNCYQQFYLNQALCTTNGYVCLIEDQVQKYCTECQLNCKTCNYDPLNAKNLNCTICKDGYYLQDNLCHQCLANCKTCTSLTNCLSCSEGSQVIPNCQCEEGKINQVTQNSASCIDHTPFSTFTSSNLCPDQTYLEQFRINMRCSSCPITCSNCAFLNAETYCIACNDGYYLRNNECEECNPLCKTCSDYYVCIQCNSDAQAPNCTCNGFFFVDRKICTLQCDEQQGRIVLKDFQNNRICYGCPQGCQVCATSLEGVICTKCYDGYYLEDGICQYCSPHCLSCVDSNVCQSCRKNHGALPDCTCSPGQLDMDEFCVTLTDTDALKFCPFGFMVIIDSNQVFQCVDCDDGCLNCTLQNDFIQCLECGQGYFLQKLENNQFCQQCDSKCSACSNTSKNCLQCKQSDAVSPSCKCPKYEDLNTNTCVNSCLPGQYLLNDQCLPCDINCQDCQLSVCQKCAQSYYLQNGQCQICSPQCAVCVQDPNNCTICRSDRINHIPNCPCPSLSHIDPLKDSICFQFPDINLANATEDQKKQLCPAYNSIYYFDADNQQSTCYFCSLNCLQCSNDGPTTQCLKCRDGYQGNNCVKCPSSCYGCNPDGSCIQCQAGYNLNIEDMSCTFDCSLECEECNEMFNNCTQCSILRSPTPQCDCQDEYFQNLYTGLCQPDFNFKYQQLDLKTFTQHRRMLQNNVVDQTVPNDSGSGQHQELPTMSQPYTPPVTGLTVWNICQPGTYFQTVGDQTLYTCLPCKQDFCSSCLPLGTDTLCVQCSDNFILNPETLDCIPSDQVPNIECQVNQFIQLKGRNFLCENCPFPCKKCSSTSQFQCNECAAGYFLQVTVANLLEQRCKKCAVGFCLECDSIICKKCLTDFFLIKNTCIFKDNVVPEGEKPQCQKNQVININDQMQYFCDSCPQYCATCSNTDDQVICQSCAQGYQLDSTTKLCQNPCPVGNFYSNDSKSCLKCDAQPGMPNCDSCGYQDSKVVCFICKANFSYKNGECEQKCTSGEYFSGGACTACTGNCSACTYDQIIHQLICFQCQDNFILTQGQCIGSLIIILQSKALISQNCSDNQASVYSQRFEGFDCRLCQQGCSNCSSDNQNVHCDKCSSNYVMVNGYCERSTFIQCTSIQTVIYQDDKYSCQNCPENCVNCQVPTSCAICSTGYLLNEIFKCEPAGIDCKNGKIYVVNAAAPQQGICKQCTENCSEGECYQKDQFSKTEVPECAQCNDPYILTSDSLVCTSLWQEGKKIDCNQNQYQLKKGNLLMCVDCPYPCIKCEYPNPVSDVPPICLMCSSGFTLQPNGCLPICAAKEYFNNNNNGCKACPGGCATCISNYPQVTVECLKCIGGWEMTADETCQQTVISICPMNSVYSVDTNRCICFDRSLTWNPLINQCVSTITMNAENPICWDTKCKGCLGPLPQDCTQCIMGFYLSNNNCLKCSSNCQHCDGQRACVTCNQGYFLYQTINGEAYCALTCPSGYLPFVDSLYRLNPELFPPLKVSSIRSADLKAQDENTQSAIAIGSEGVSIFDQARVPFTYENGTFKANYQGVPVRARCYVCIVNCQQCPDGWILNDQDSNKCIYLECPYPLQKVKTDDSFYKCQTSQNIRIISPTLDPKGYQTSSKSLKLNLLTSSSDIVTWSLDAIYDGSSLNPFQLFDIYEYADKYAEVEVTFSKPQRDLIVPYLINSNSIEIPFNYIHRKQIYRFSANQKGLGTVIYIPVVFLPTVRKIEELGILMVGIILFANYFQSSFSVYPASGFAVSDSFTAYYNFLPIQDLLSDQCSDHGAIFEITLFEADYKDTPRDQMSDFRISRTSPNPQLYYDLTIPYIYEQTYIAVEFTIHCQQYIFTGFKKIHVQPKPLVITDSQQFKRVSNRNQDLMIEDIEFVAGSLYNQYLQQSILGVKGLLPVNNQSTSKNTTDTSNKNDTVNGTATNGTDTNGTNTNGTNNHTRMRQLRQLSDTASQPLPQNETLDNFEDMNFIPFLEPDFADNLTFFYDLDPLNIATDPFVFYNQIKLQDYKYSCPPNNQCSKRGQCVQVSYFFQCNCFKGYSGLNCQFTNDQFKQVSLIQQKTIASILYANEVHLSDIETRLYTLHLLSQIEVANISFITDLINVTNAVTAEAFNDQTISLGFSIVSHITNMLALPSYQPYQLASWYTNLDEVVSNLQEKISCLLSNDQDIAFQSGNAYINTKQVDLSYISENGTVIVYSDNRKGISIEVPVFVFNNDSIVNAQINAYPSTFYLDTGSVIPGDVVDFKFFKKASNKEYSVQDVIVKITFPMPQNINLTEITNINLKLKCKWLNDRAFVSDGCSTSYDVLDEMVLCTCSHLSQYTLVIGVANLDGAAGDKADSQLPSSLLYPRNNNFPQNPGNGDDDSNISDPDGVAQRDVPREVHYQDFSKSLPFVIIILSLSVYIIQMMIGYWFDRQQEEEQVLSDITDVELKGRVISCLSYVQAILILRNPISSLSYFHITLPRPVRLLFSLTKTLTIFTLCSFFNDVPWMGNLISCILINISLQPLNVLLQLLKTYLSRSRRLIPVAYCVNIAISLVLLIVVIIEGIESEPFKEDLDQWGLMIIKSLIWEILIFDSVKAILSVFIYRSIIEDGENSLWRLVDNYEMKQFYKSNTKQSIQGLDENVRGFQNQKPQKLNEQDESQLNSVRSYRDTRTEQPKMPWEHESIQQVGSPQSPSQQKLNEKARNEWSAKNDDL